MAKITIGPDFRELLSIFNSHEVRYLLIGSFAVGIHGYVRATGDMDVWVSHDPQNAQRAFSALHEFGMSPTVETLKILGLPKSIIRMGQPPLRVDITTSPTGVEFEECYSSRVIEDFDGLEVPVIDLVHLRQNKAAAGRDKDLLDLRHLPEP